MSAGVIGLAMGGVFGFASYQALQKLKERVSKDETKKVLQIVSMIDLISFPIIGYVIGAYVFG